MWHNISNFAVINSRDVKLEFFSPLGKLAGRAIYFTCVNFFLFLN